MAGVKEGDTVRVHYVAKLTDGTVFDSSEGRDPIELTVGAGQVLPLFEESLHGMKAGDKKTFNVKSEEAYGERRDDLIVDVERSQLPEDFNYEVGTQLQVAGEGGQPAIVTVMEIGEESVKLDANHPLAGKDLVFDIELESIVK